eukprot:Pompholyxophrys_punicea_v1_NODE_1499_length_682_cov_10.910686.p1 type:complete len:129 gc:universal NODE_1499_length_682_cov_10.910686:451-65(-)
MLCHQRTRKYYNALVAFNEVVESCFGLYRSGDFQLKIEAFKIAYKTTGLSVTLKVHLLLEHVAEYLLNYAGDGIGLGFYSEQAAESAHSKFRHCWERYQTQRDNEHYAAQLGRCVVDFNFNRINFDLP